MSLKPSHFSIREQLILSGLFLSKFDQAGLRRLGFHSFTEAFNVIGFALGGKPASVKNYRDEFDPRYPNARQGWHQRPLREHCRRIEEQFGALELDEYGYLIESFFDYHRETSDQTERPDSAGDENSAFAKRLLTGLAAERYFEAVFGTISIFAGRVVENTTRLGCGYDYRLKALNADNFFAVEVKGLQEKTGSLSFTPKEYATASKLSEHYFLFVVRNFREKPFHEIYQNPLGAGLRFVKREEVVVRTTWNVTI